MTFKEIPQHYAPLGGELYYAVGTDTAGTLEVRIRNAAGKLLGTKRFTGVDEARFDVAPYLRRMVLFSPAAGGTGPFAATDRTVTATVEAGIAAGQRGGAASDTSAEKVSANDSPATIPASDTSTIGAKTVAPTTAADTATDGWQPIATAAARTFLPSDVPATAPALLTTMPFSRMIGPAECDELTLLTDGPCLVAITARSAYSSMAEVHRIAAAGPHLFRIDLREFPDTETLTVEAGNCGTVRYTIVPPPDGARRLAWRSRAGSVEHYTFPVEHSVVIRTARQRVCGPGGQGAVVTQEERVTTLRSAYEVRAVLEALSGILAAPQVWLVEKSNYIPVNVLTESMTVHRHGAMSCMELAIAQHLKTRPTWN